MIVECTNCDTRFQLDDARVPLRGIRVRCSHCKEAFFLEHPDAGKAEAIDDVAAAAVDGAAPDTTQDLPAGNSVAVEPSGESDEEDWEFNAEFPTDDPAEAEAAAADDDPFGSADDEDLGLAEDDLEADAEVEDSVPGLGVDDTSGNDEEGFSSGLDLASEGGEPVADVAEEAHAPDADLGAEIDDEAVEEALADLSGQDAASDFGEVTDFSALAEDASADAGGTESPPEVTPAAATETAAAVAPQEIGEPEDWDFFSDDADGETSVESMDNAMGRVMEAVEDPSRLKGPSRDPDLGSALPGRSVGAASLQSLARSVGWIVTCCLFGLGIARGVFDVQASGEDALSSASLGPFEAEQVRGAWYATARSTRLYAVTGQLVNNSSAARAPGDGLRVALVSPAGARLEIPAAPASVVIGEADLRELAAADLEWVRRQNVARLAVTRLEPGAGVPFLAFFDRVPDQATGFVLELDPVPEPLRAAPAVLNPDAVLDPAAPLAPGTVLDPAAALDPGAALDPAAVTDDALLEMPDAVAPEVLQPERVRTATSAAPLPTASPRPLR